ncbi:MAG: L-histidine N(alpha)-methyltransferase [Betaproteobacteria bacterium]|nr:L-histidine N(alpha)-methyltransferase [Betaproteobacteria bacterium]MBK7743329.1 L-histidine N(alpha)-methyltransferase [Betaproteobacteria bacterium]MBK8688018.1 L-histidine N(alpha)-methyltransferase [Betaproteobacteria bacterium]
MRTPRFLQLRRDDQAAVRTELLRGLTAPAATTSPKYLYDALGSRLFEAITELPEYDLTRNEAAIFAARAEAMSARVPGGATWIDLGAGNCCKAARLFPRFAPRRYVAVDIAVDFLQSALETLQRQHPELEIVGLGLDFSTRLELPAGAVDADGARVLFYPGSSIGNFTPAEAQVFLRSVHAACGTAAGSGLLIGVDLVRDAAALEAAYDDALGVTAAFNRNLLLHVNRLAGTDFAVRDWSHVAVFNAARSRIEMHLQARRDLTVRWAGGERAFAAGERIHTENSCKWTLPDFEALLTQAGFARGESWTDDARRFAVVWAPAAAAPR